jgi:hypothetical protein
VVAGKDGTIFLLDRGNLGEWATNDTQVVQTFKSDAIFSLCTPAFWNNTAFFGFLAGSIEAFQFDPKTQLLNPTPTSTSGSVQISYPGATPSISADGAQNGILWVVQNSGPHAVLRAFDAMNLTAELYSSDMSSVRDSAGPSVAFAVPTVTGGKVFVGTSGELDIYGLLSK